MRLRGRTRSGGADPACTMRPYPRKTQLDLLWHEGLPGHGWFHSQDRARRASTRRNDDRALAADDAGRGVPVSRVVAARAVLPSIRRGPPAARRASGLRATGFTASRGVNAFLPPSEHARENGGPACPVPHLISPRHHLPAPSSQVPIYEKTTPGLIKINSRAPSGDIFSQTSISYSDFEALFTSGSQNRQQY